MSYLETAPQFNRANKSLLIDQKIIEFEQALELIQLNFERQEKLIEEKFD